MTSCIATSTSKEEHINDLDLHFCGLRESDVPQDPYTADHYIRTPCRTRINAHFDSSARMPRCRRDGRDVHALTGCVSHPRVWVVEQREDETINIKKDEHQHFVRLATPPHRHRHNNTGKRRSPIGRGRRAPSQEILGCSTRQSNPPIDTTATRRCTYSPTRPPFIQSHILSSQQPKIHSTILRPHTQTEHHGTKEAPATQEKTPKKNPPPTLLREKRIK